MLSHARHRTPYIHNKKNRNTDPGWVSYLREGCILHYLQYSSSRFSYIPVYISLPFLLPCFLLLPLSYSAVHGICCTLWYALGLSKSLRSEKGYLTIKNKTKKKRKKAASATRKAVSATSTALQVAKPSSG